MRGRLAPALAATLAALASVAACGGRLAELASDERGDAQVGADAGGSASGEADQPPTGSANDAAPGFAPHGDDAAVRHDARGPHDARAPDAAGDATIDAVAGDAAPPDAPTDANVDTDAPSDAAIIGCGPGIPPVGYWTFAGCSDASRVVADQSGNGFDALKNSGVTCIPGRSGLAGSFDGVAAEVDIADEPAFHMTTAVTLAAWVNPSQTAGLRTILNKWYGMDSYMILVHDGRYEFSVALPGGTWGVQTTAGAPATASTWAHVAGVYDGTSAILYVNGAQAAQAFAVPPGTTASLQQSQRPLCIGNCPSWNAFAGSIQDVWLGAAALTQAQVAQLAFGCDADAAP